MIRLTLLIALFFSGIYLNTIEDDCWQMNDGWESEKKAISQIEHTCFKTSDSVSPDQESWMNSAHYYQCNDDIGYLIVKCNKKTMVHKNVPLAIWNNLKEAKPIVGYYNFYIKNKYKLDKKSANPTI